MRIDWTTGQASEGADDGLDKIATNKGIIASLSKQLVSERRSIRFDACLSGSSITNMVCLLVLRIESIASDLMLPRASTDAKLFAQALWIFYFINFSCRMLRLRAIASIIARA